MSGHATHAMHDNSLAAYRDEEPKLSARAEAVLEWIREHGPATDRQIMGGMGFAEPNAVRPRVTELVQAGRLAELRDVRCPTTGKTVRVVGLPEKQGGLFS